MTTSIGRPAKRTYARKNLTKNDRIILAVLKDKGAAEGFEILPQKYLSLITRLHQSRVCETLDRLTYKGYIERMKVSKFDAIRLIK